MWHSVRADDEIYELLRNEAHRRRIPMWKVIREAVLAWLAREDDPA